MFTVVLFLFTGSLDCVLNVGCFSGGLVLWPWFRKWGQGHAAVDRFARAVVHQNRGNLDNQKLDPQFLHMVLQASTDGTDVSF